MSDNITHYNFREDLPLEFEIIDMDKIFEMNRELLTVPTRAEFYHIFWFKTGNLTHTIDFKPVYIPPNSLLFLTKDAVQVFDQNGNYDGKIVLFTDRFFGQTEKDLQYLKQSILYYDLFEVSPVQLHECEGVLHQLIGLMEEEFMKNGEESQSEIIQNYLDSFLRIAERERKKQGFKEVRKSVDLEYFVLFKDLLHEHFVQNKKVNYYASALSITKKRLNQATAKIIGKSPKEIIDERIILEAKRLLAHSQMTTKSIAYQLGFGEPTNFIKYFKRLEEITPLEFREKLLNAAS